MTKNKPLTAHGPSPKDNPADAHRFAQLSKKHPEWAHKLPAVLHLAAEEGYTVVEDTNDEGRPRITVHLSGLDEWLPQPTLVVEELKMGEAGHIQVKASVTVSTWWVGDVPENSVQPPNHNALMPLKEFAYELVRALFESAYVVSGVETYEQARRWVGLDDPTDQPESTPPRAQNRIKPIT